MGCLSATANRIGVSPNIDATDLTRRLKVTATLLCSVGQIGNGEAFRVSEGDFLVFEGKFLVKRIKTENYDRL